MGAGVSGTSVLQGMVKLLQEGESESSYHPPISIHVFERGGQCGAGMPYGERYNEPEHLMNLMVSQMGYEPTEFRRWLVDNGENIRARLAAMFVARAAAKASMRPDAVPSDTFVSIHDRNAGRTLELLERDDVDETYFPRVIFGYFLEDQFMRACEELSYRGIEIHVVEDCEIISVTKRDTGLRLVGDCNGERKTTEVDHVVIATGHWDKGTGGTPDHTTKSIWPAGCLVRDLQRSIANIRNTPVAQVAIKGSSLSAIDALKTVVFSNGGVVGNDAGSIDFIPPTFTDHDGVNVQVRVDMLSRNGLLPRVRGRSGSHRNLYLTADNLKVIASNHGDRIGLSHVWALLKKELNAAYAEYGMVNPYQHPDSLVDLDTPAFVQLERDIDLAKNGDAPDGTVAWQTVYIQASTAFSIAFCLLHPSDRAQFLAKWRTLHMYHVAPMPIETAEELLALHRHGFVDVVRVQATSNRQDLTQRYDVVIEVLGQESRHEDNPHSLFQGAIKDGLITPTERLLKPRSVDGVDTIGVASLAFGTSRASRCMEAGFEIAEQILRPHEHVLDSVESVSA